MTGPKGYLLRFGLAIVSIGFALVLAELAVRLFFPYSRDHVLPGHLFAIDEGLGWGLEPNRKVVHKTRYFDVVYQTNGRGFRDRHRDADTHDRRVLLFGDSQVFGWGVSEADRFSNRIEQEVPSLEMWNFGVPAYGLDQEILAYQKEGAALVADSVMFFVSETTLYRAHHDWLYGKPKPIFVRGANGALRSLPPRGVGRARLLYALLSSFYLPQFANREIARWQRGAPSDRALEEPEHSDTRRNLSELERSLLLLARDIAMERGHRMLVLTSLSPDRTANVAALCRRHGLGFVGLSFGEARGELVFGSEDSHWTAETHERVAREILAALDWDRGTRAEAHSASTKGR